MDELNDLKNQIEFLKFRLDQAYRITKIYEDFILNEVGFERFTEFMKKVMNDLMSYDMNMSPELEECLSNVFMEENEETTNVDFDEDDNDEDSI